MRSSDSVGTNPNSCIKNLWKWGLATVVVAKVEPVPCELCFGKTRIQEEAQEINETLKESLRRFPGFRMQNLLAASVGFLFKTQLLWE